MFQELNLNKNNLVKFGRTMCVCLLIIAALLFLRHSPAYKAVFGAGLLFLCFAQVSPRVLTPVYAVWMSIGFCMGWINTRVILIVTYYCLLTPIGLILKLFAKDLLQLRLKNDLTTYWQKREPLKNAKESYERIF